MCLFHGWIAIGIDKLKAGVFLIIDMDEMIDMESEIILLQDLVKPHTLRLEPFLSSQWMRRATWSHRGKLPLGRC